GGLENVGERLVDAGRQRTVTIKVHRCLDLNARKARRLLALENIRQVALETLLDVTTAWAGVAAREHPAVREAGEARQQNIRRNFSEFAALFDDGDVRHVPLAGAQQGALVAVLEHRLQPSFRQQRQDERWQLARRRLPDQRRAAFIGLFPPPFKAVVNEVADRLAVPGDYQVKRRFVRRRCCGGTVQQVSLGQLALAIPLIF